MAATCFSPIGKRCEHQMWGSSKRIASHQVEELSRFPRLAPDLAIEVLFPSDKMVDALSKVTMYLQAGVRTVWLVDPAKRKVTIFLPDEPLTTLGVGESLNGGKVLPGFTVPVAEIFR